MEILCLQVTETTLSVLNKKRGLMRIDGRLWDLCVFFLISLHRLSFRADKGNGGYEC